VGSLASALLLVLLAASPLAAGEPATLAARLAEVQRVQAAIRTMRATFVQRRHVALFEGELESRGRFYFKRPDRVRWDVEMPISSTLILTDNGLSGTQPDGSPVRAAGLPISAAEITGLLSGSVETAALHFAIGWPSDAHGGYTFVLRPRSPRLRRLLQSVVLDLAPREKSLRRIIITEAGGDRTEITFEHMEINRAIPDEYFVLGRDPETN
jgi:outer membrane lipoprotein carrier protein